MVRKRATFDPLESTGLPRWYVVRSMHGSLIESREISGESDLRRVFVAAMLEWMDAGWSLGITVTRHSSNEVPGGWTDVTGSGVAQMGVDITAAPVPEPATMATLALGCVLMLYRRKK